MWVGATGAFLAAVPITSYITGDNGVVQKAMETLLAVIPGGSSIAKERTIPALSALYIFATFAATGAGSVAGQAMSRKDGLDNNSTSDTLTPQSLNLHGMQAKTNIPRPTAPRAHTGSMSGLPLRLRSAHYNLMEMFPGFALAAALTQALAPANQNLINLLGLHVMAKLLLFYPAYLADIAPPRSLAHMIATGSVVNVAYKLALGAR